MLGNVVGPLSLMRCDARRCDEDAAESSLRRKEFRNAIARLCGSSPWLAVTKMSIFEFFQRVGAHLNGS